jgi:pimeloyl-ACP methyl ester carboxylesterase
VPDTPENRAHRQRLEAAFLPALREAAGPRGLVETFEYDGDPSEPARLVAHAASPGSPERRPTILFLHGKGGFAAEWRRDAVRALRLGYNVLAPELRGHPPSGGRRITYGLRETRDLSLLVAGAGRRFGIGSGGLGIDGASMGALLAIGMAAGNPDVRALWLRSPFASLPAMAAQYLARATGLPRLLVSLPARLTVALAERSTGLPLSRLDPLLAARCTACPAVVVHGAEDALVPLSFARPVFDALGGRKELWIVPRAGHEHHADEPSGLKAAAYARRWEAFFRKFLPPALRTRPRWPAGTRERRRPRRRPAGPGA